MMLLEYMAFVFDLVWSGVGIVGGVFLICLLLGVIHQEVREWWTE